jgi:hypothetical protein
MFVQHWRHTERFQKALRQLDLDSDSDCSPAATTIDPPTKDRHIRLLTEHLDRTSTLLVTALHRLEIAESATAAQRQPTQHALQLDLPTGAPPPTDMQAPTANDRALYMNSRVLALEQQLADLSAAVAAVTVPHAAPTRSNAARKHTDRSRYFKCKRCTGKHRTRDCDKRRSREPSVTSSDDSTSSPTATPTPEDAKLSRALTLLHQLETAAPWQVPTPTEVDMPHTHDELMWMVRHNSELPHRTCLRYRPRRHSDLDSYMSVVLELLDNVPTGVLSTAHRTVNALLLDLLPDSTHLRSQAQKLVHNAAAGADHRHQPLPSDTYDTDPHITAGIVQRFFCCDEAGLDTQRPTQHNSKDFSQSFNLRSALLSYRWCCSAPN